jgi:hypothetical protein
MIVRLFNMHFLYVYLISLGIGISFFLETKKEIYWFFRFIWIKTEIFEFLIEYFMRFFRVVYIFSSLSQQQVKKEWKQEKRMMNFQKKGSAGYWNPRVIEGLYSPASYHPSG